MEIGIAHYLTVSAILFTLGVFGVFLNRKNVIVILMSVELILLAVNLNFVAFSAALNDLTGQIFALFVLTVAGRSAFPSAPCEPRVQVVEDVLHAQRPRRAIGAEPRARTAGEPGVDEVEDVLHAQRAGLVEIGVAAGHGVVAQSVAGRVRPCVLPGAGCERADRAGRAEAARPDRRGTGRE